MRVFSSVNSLLTASCLRAHMCVRKKRKKKKKENKEEEDFHRFFSRYGYFSNSRLRKLEIHRPIRRNRNSEINDDLWNT
jgi:hypothetical protein